MGAQTTNPGSDRLLGVADVAGVLGLAEKTIRNAIWARAHGLPCGTPIPPFGRLGRRLVVRASVFEQWLNRAIEPIETSAER